MRSGWRQEIEAKAKTDADSSPDHPDEQVRSPGTPVTAQNDRDVGYGQGIEQGRAAGLGTFGR